MSKRTIETAIIFEVSNGKAVVMKPNGQFVTVPADSKWQEGEVVLLKNQGLSRKHVLSIAACFLLFVSISVFGYLYFDEISLISIDVNPSIELGLNRFDRVISISAMNDEGLQIIKKTSIINKTFNNAITTLLENGIDSFMSDNSYITFTVLSETKNNEAIILSTLQNTAKTYILSHHISARVELFAVDKSFVAEAHSHRVTAGKYSALLQLKQIQPQIDITEYLHHSITDIKNQINSHNQEHNNKHNEGHR